MNVKQIATLGTALFIGISLTGCESKSESNNTLKLSIPNQTTTLSSNGTADIDFSTTKNAKYKVLDKDNHNAQIGKTYTAKTGNATLTLNSAGHYRLEVKKGDSVKDKDFTVKSPKTASNSSQKSESSNLTLTFGKSEMLKNGSTIAELTVNSVTQVSADDSMVADISSNEPDKKQFVIVSYTLKAISGNLSTDDFDGSNLSIADSKNSIGSTSSNRDNGIPDEVKTGQSIKLRIGAGFEHTGDTATVSFGDNTWIGNITK